MREVVGAASFAPDVATIGPGGSDDAAAAVALADFKGEYPLLGEEGLWSPPSLPRVVGDEKYDTTRSETVRDTAPNNVLADCGIGDLLGDGGAGAAAGGEGDVAGCSTGDGKDEEAGSVASRVTE